LPFSSFPFGVCIAVDGLLTTHVEDHNTDNTTVGVPYMTLTRALDAAQQAHVVFPVHDPSRVHGIDDVQVVVRRVAANSLQDHAQFRG
jgi:hypothetical protein